MKEIFISHSSKDNSFCEQVKNRLEQQGHRSLFLDYDPAYGIPAGRNWERELYKRLSECRAIVVLCSQHSMSSEWCFAEIVSAKSLGKHIFPIKISPCDVVGLLRDVQVIDMTSVDEEEAYQRLWDGLKIAGVTSNEFYVWDNSRPPYPGLMAFEEEDAAIFFGRDREVREGLGLLNQLRRFGGSRLLLVLGASGSGKSSVVKAGILPQLRRDKRSWVVLKPFRKRGNPFDELSKALVDCLNNGVGLERDWSSLSQDLQQAALADPPDLSVLLEVADSLREPPGQENATILLVADQFEELLSDNSADEDLEMRFLSLLRAFLDLEDCPFLVVGTLRSDFLGAFQDCKALQGIDFKSLCVSRMSVEKILEVIEGPAKVAGIQLEDGLALAMANDTKADDALPLLAFTLRELWEQFGEDRYLEIDEYRSQDKLGGLAGSVARAADAVLDSYISPKNPERNQVERALRKAFLKLVRINEEGQFARQTAFWKDLPAEIHDLLERFVKARLLISGSELTFEANNSFIDRVPDSFLEVAHEVLFRTWPKLASWLGEDREFLLWKRRLSEDLAAWEESGQSDERLLRGIPLSHAEDWRQKNSHNLRESEQEFIQLSLALRDREVREKANRRKILIGLTVGTSLAIGFAGVIASTLAFRNQRLQQVLSDVTLGLDVNTPELLRWLPTLLSAADRLQSQGEIEADQAIAYYRTVLNESLKLQNRLQKHPESFSNPEADEKKIQAIVLDAERSLLDTIRSYRLPVLKTYLDESPPLIGEPPLISPLSEPLEPEGALELTYSILFDDMGADLNQNGYLDNAKEASRMPCPLLIELERIWRHSSQERCGWFGQNVNIDTIYEDSACSELNQQTLTFWIFEHVTDYLAIQQLNECGIKPGEPISHSGVR